MKLPLLVLACCVANSAWAQAGPEPRDPMASSPEATTETDTEPTPTAEAGTATENEPTPRAPEDSTASPAEPQAATDTEATPGAPAEVNLVVRGSIEGIDSVALARALERELGRTVVVSFPESAGAVRLELSTSSDRTLVVRFYATGREPLERTVGDPSEPGERFELLVLLGSSMVNDGLVRSEPLEPTQVAPEPPSEAPPLPVSPGHFSLVHPLATNAAEPNIITHFSISFIQGRVGRVEGLAFGGYQSARHGVEGFQLAYLANFSGARVEGAQFGFLVNVAKGVTGLQAAGINVTTSGLSGAQLGFLNLAGGASQGILLGIIANYAADLEGANLALGVNVSKDTQGITATAGVNVARDLEGVQVGTVNVARSVRGVQLGLINVAEEISGVPIGVINVSKSGGVHPMAWYSTATPANFGVRFASRPTYSTLYGSWDVERKYAGMGYELGASIPIALDRVFVEVSLSEVYLVDTQKVRLDAGRSLTELRGSLRFQVFDHLGFLAGVGYVGKVERATEDFANVKKGDWYYDGFANFSVGILL